MKIIVGLGNPGSKHQDTRHNVGFMAIDKLAEQENLTWHTAKDFNALIAKGLDYYLVKPNTFMNNSGEAVQKIMAYYHLLPETTDSQADLTQSLTVIHDDLDINLGSYKISVSGSAGGHNGVKSIIEHLGTPYFTRLRLGVATPTLDKARKSILPGAVARFVLKRFGKEEVPLINEVIDRVLKNI